jgi:hypothetical protein
MTLFCNVNKLANKTVIAKAAIGYAGGGGCPSCGGGNGRLMPKTA